VVVEEFSGTKAVTHALGDKVRIDFDVEALVIGIAIYPSGVEYKVSWWHNGTIHDAWLADWRVCKEAA
jgi:hypothetical protein